LGRGWRRLSEERSDLRRRPFPQRNPNVLRNREG
jgi:hypothetical protein